MATEKILKVRTEIENVMMKYFPREYLMYVFGGKLTVDDVVTHVLVECSKRAYDSTEEKYSLRHHFSVNGIEDESDQRRIHRSQEHAYKYRKTEYELLSARGLHYPDLLPPPMDTIDQKISGHEKNAFQFWELNNIRDMELVSSIVDRRISKKNTTMQQIIDIDRQYCDIIQDIQKSEDRAFAFMAMFTLEWKYSFDFVYEIADAMEREGVTYSEELGKKAAAFCGRVSINSYINGFATDFQRYDVPPCRVDAESRMLHPRRKYIPDILNGGRVDEVPSETHRFLEGLALASLLFQNMTLRDIPLFEWFCRNTDKSDWISVFEDYDVYGTFIMNKEWTRKTVRNLKSIYNDLSFDYKG